MLNHREHPKDHGIVLFAHGARDPNWAKPFESVREQLAALTNGGHVRLAYLEFMQPSLLEAGQALAHLQCNTVSVIPLFLGAGGHVRKDLPGLLETLQQRHPQVLWQLCPAIGEHPDVVQAMACAALKMTQTGMSAHTKASA